MMRLSETAAGLTLSYPAWIALLFFAGGIALGLHVLRRFAWTGRMFGLVMATAICLLGGVYFFTLKVTLDADGVHTYAFMRGSAHAEWRHVVSVNVEERSGRGRPTYIVAGTAGGDAVEMPVTDLSGVNRRRMIDYIEARRAAAK